MGHRNNNRHKRNKPRSALRLYFYKLAPAVFVLGAIGVSQNESVAQFLQYPTQTVSSGELCKIKGNVSYNRGKKIYHVPGQKDYRNTKISSNRGERWFCSENEARAHGWVKAPR